ncbi:Uu.00g144570.m01.CDS01 [Anthostomella pinea]|uniref:Uu.00g144570.m01.CDS01 n=1 Tax=Anthostomella pinea TaxID=933095 RepID=A0AAI8VQV1_9PEZI|nr:Uu.00g144570.m01.CDS01 [Anthostomella pinea]
MGEIERRRSFGVGGAGNIRTRAEAELHDWPPTDNKERRRISLTSSSSHHDGERRSSKVSETIKNIFRSPGTKSDSETTE